MNHPAVASRMDRRRRRGLSLLEVILALSVLVIAMVLIGELIAMGIDSAAASRDLNRAQLLCESKMAELAAVPVLPQVQHEVPFDDDPEWLYSVDVQSNSSLGIAELKVTVMPKEAARRDLGQLSLTRWIVDPDANR